MTLTLNVLHYTVHAVVVEPSHLTVDAVKSEPSDSLSFLGQRTHVCGRSSVWTRPVHTSVRGRYDGREVKKQVKPYM